VNSTAPFTREELVNHFNNNLIETRNLFAGNITRQPALQSAFFRVSGSLENTDYIMNNTFFLGTFPGLNEKMMQHIDAVLKDFLSKYL
jgi:CDP-6-deoxy-D-xylo-4-hexulose-3-dehydrase